MEPTARTAVYQRPWLYDKQTRALFAPERISLIEASTKAGKTVGGIVWLAEQAMRGKPSHNYWWVAPIYPQAKIAFRRMKKALPRALATPNESELTVTLANGTVIWFKGADRPDSLYGEDVYAAVIDEASRCREDAWYAIRSTLTATRGPLRIIGNVKGRKNWFYRMARRAEAGATDMSYHRITARDAVAAGVLDQDEIEAARRDLPEEVFKELYEAEASDDQGNPFGIVAIGRCLGELSTARPVAFGWDLAKSVDWTAGVGLDGDMATAAFHRFQSPWEETLTAIERATGRVPALVDATGVGDPIVERLQRTPGSGYEGFKFTSQSKQAIMEGLAVAIQRQDVRFPDGVIRHELEAFEYVYTRTGVRYSAPEGMHDDCVCALALAVSKLNKPVDRAIFLGFA